MKNDAVVQPTLNMVIYMGAGKCQVKGHELYALGGHGYTYDIAVAGKRNLVKDVATTAGYYTGNPQKPNTVVVVEDVATLTAPNCHSELSALLTGLRCVIEYMMSHPEYKNLCVITTHKIVASVVLLRSKLEERAYKLGRYEMTEKEIDEARTFLALLNTWEEGDHKVIFDVDASIEGGKGIKSMAQQQGLAEVITMWSDDKYPTLCLQDRKTYENPESDFNKLVSATRWYFMTGEESDYYAESRGYRMYDFGKVEPDKKYYGKLTPDVTYSRLYVKEPIVLLDKLYEFTERTVPNPNGLLSAGNLTNVKSKDLVRLIDTYPAVRDKNDLIMPYTVGGQEEPLLVELIDPPMLTFRIKDSFTQLANVFSSFLDRDEKNWFKTTQFIDITDQIYVKEENKKGELKLKLNPAFTMTTNVIKVKAEHRNAIKPVVITLGLGLDIPERNAFNSVDDTSVKVWCVADTHNDKGIRYCTIVETDSFIYVHTTGVANLRVLALNELGEKA